MVHGFGVNKQFERRAGLAHGRYLVVFPRLEVNVAYPCFYMPVLRFHRHETGVHELHHVAYRIECGHFFLLLAVVIKKLYLVFLVEVVEYRVFIAVFLTERLVMVGLFRKILYEIWNDVMVLIPPRVLVAPMVAEIALHGAHLLYKSLFGVFLHFIVERGVYLKPRAVKVDSVVLAPLSQVIGHGFAEIQGFAVVNGLDFIIQAKRQFLYRIAFLLCQMSVLLHIVEHHVAPHNTVFRVYPWIVCACSFQQTHQYSRLFGRKVFGRGIEVCFCGSLYSESV